VFRVNLWAGLNWKSRYIAAWTSQAIDYSLRQGIDTELEDWHRATTASRLSVLDPHHMGMLLRKSRGDDPGRYGRERRAQANRCKRRNSTDDVKTGGWHTLRDQLGDVLRYCPSGIRRIGGTKLDEALVRNVRTWPVMLSEGHRKLPRCYISLSGGQGPFHQVGGPAELCHLRPPLD
jgi:hypothetical protein